jgi:transposase
MWKTQLIALYYAVYRYYDTRICVKVQRLSNNNRPQFTDQELMSVYLWGIQQRLFTTKAIYQYTSRHLREWFPHLPSYQAFNRRLDEMGMAFATLSECLLGDRPSDAYALTTLLVDSMPIALAKLCRADHAKVARELCAKTYNPSRKEWYYGVKLHAVVQNRQGKLPALLIAMLSPANDHDLPVAKQIVERIGLWNGPLFADKAYDDAQWKRDLLQRHNIRLVTPYRRHRGDPALSPGRCAADAFVCSVRQKIEIFFNWLNDTTHIQSASKIRSLKGLFLHVFGRLAAALASSSSAILNC